MSNETEDTSALCLQGFLSIGTFYSENISGYADIPICIIGAVFNLFNVLVYTRKNMISPASTIFTHLSFIDLLVLLAYVPFSWQQYIRKKDEALPYKMVLFSLLCNDLSVLLHAISIWLTIMLAVWRYIAVVHPLKEVQWCNMKATRNLVATGYVLCTVLCIPLFSSQTIEEEIENGQTVYLVVFRDNPVMYSLTFVIHGVLLKLMPSLVLAFVSYRLIVTLLISKKRHHKLTSSSVLQKTPENIKRKQKVDRSTKILLAVLGLFLIAEAPLGILGLLNAIYRHSKYYECYDNLGRILDTVALINTSVTFVVYYLMSQQFKKTFESLFGRFNSIYSRKDVIARRVSGNTTSSATSEV
ncbi:G-protein coupled receptor dmsr-1-like isoform X2 [Planococcus citri]|uniref:G-protein coupled receptor dmsr-1-like isoform X2 n=1 Tax=Planococcus citri TaxID=170843 RepID=UPI0031F8EECB